MLPYFGSLAQQTIVAAAPVVQSITLTSFGTNTTAHLVNMPPAVDAGDLILVIFCPDGAPTTTSTGFTSVYDASYGTNVRMQIRAKIAVGNEDGTTVGFTTSVTENAGALVYRITGWGGTIASHIVAGTAVDSLVSPYDPPSLTSGFGAVPTLWIACGAASAASTPTAIPANYSSVGGSNFYAGSVTDSTSAVAVAGWRQLTAASEDPGVFTFSANTAGRMNTVAIRGTT